MKYCVQKLLLHTFYLLLLSIAHNNYGKQTIDIAADIPLVNPNTPENIRDKKIISVNFAGEDLVNIINFLAAQKDVNITLPQGDASIKSKLTLHLENKISIKEAWDLLHTILHIAGFSLVPSPNGYIIKSENTVSREPLPIYIGIKPEDLPETDQTIRYLYYLSNIKVSDESEINEILKQLLPPNSLFRNDVSTNGLFIVAKSVDIKAVMRIILQLDQVNFQEQISVIKLRHAKAKNVADLFNENILKAAANNNRYHLDTKKAEAFYFSRHTRIMPEERTNSLIVIGKPQAISRIKNFIFEYIDVDQESGKSILHIYQLQYLDANQFAPELRKIVESSRPGGTEQSKTTNSPTNGPERFFDEVIITVDKPAEAEKLKYYGGNKLVIAARNDDWKRIKELIEQLDTPQPQVLIEVLIADLTLDDKRLLNSLVRNPLKLPMPDQMNFQSAQMSVGVLPNSFVTPPPQTIGVLDGVFNPGTTTPVSSDLLREAFTTGCVKTDAGALSAATCGTTPGATVISLNDSTGSTWGIFQLLQLFSNTKIISHPHVIATHNKEAEILSGQTRLIPDDASGSLGGNTVLKFIQYPANLKLKITPRISSLDTVNLQIDMDINEFIPGNSANATVTRKLLTNVNVNNQDILTIGGLITTSLATNASKTPLLGDVPILGWFFKNRQGEITKTNLTVFICPTIIAPRLRGGISKYTEDYIAVANNYSSSDNFLFDSLKDPITRWFFKTGNNSMDSIEQFVKKDELKENADVIIPVENEPSMEKMNKNSMEMMHDFDKKASVAQIKEKLQSESINPFKQVKM